MNEHDDVMLRVAGYCYQALTNCAVNGQGSVFAEGYALALKDVLSLIEGTPINPLPDNHDLKLSDD